MHSSSFKENTVHWTEISKTEFNKCIKHYRIMHLCFNFDSPIFILIVVIAVLQGDRGFDGLPGLPGEKGHRVSAAELFLENSYLVSHHCCNT